jgi:hypothetical protein
MASSKPTKQEAEQLIRAQKIISTPISWKSFLGNWRLEANALEPKSNTMLKLQGYIGRDNYSFAVLFRNCPIRKYTKHRRHKFRGQVYIVPHKHLWDEVNGDREVFIPNDIGPNDNINDQFLDFYKECNIVLRGGYQRVVYELGR